METKVLFCRSDKATEMPKWFGNQECDYFRIIFEFLVTFVLNKNS